PVAVAAGLATLRLIQANRFYEALTERTRMLTQGLTKAAQEFGISFSAQNVGGMFGIYFRKNTPASYAQIMECGREKFNWFFHAMLQQGVYLAPSAFEAGFVSAAHKESDIEQTLEAARVVFSGMRA
ncbi:MAG TPA: aspartate aminotransferase family protein, partial [Methylophilaceae bacterium]|nr:aspartate aminotransferase family protein [Methylophilaceae bacterium]